MRALHKTGSKLRAGVTLLTGVACLSVLPSAVAAVSDLAIEAYPENAVSIAGSGELGAFTPSSVDPRLLEQLNLTTVAKRERSTGIFRFTPAGSNQRGQRSVTVAVRVNSETAHAISVRARPGSATDAGRGAVAGVAPVAFNLGVARGYQSFAHEQAETPSTGKALTAQAEIRKLDMPDLSSFTPSRSSQRSRFSAVVELDQGELPGSSPRTISGDSDVSVDVGGAFRVTKNLKVTAGVRYSEDRNRLAPLTNEQQDSQAVYVGTKFRF